MQSFNDQNTVTVIYQVPEELNICLEKAASVFEVSEEAVVIQALKEFCEKHGIRRTDEIA